MIVRHGKNSCTTVVKTYDGSESTMHIIVGTSHLDCSRHAGRRIADAMKAGHEVSWNSDSGNEIRVFLRTDDYDSGDRYICSHLTTASDKGRIVYHRERRRANPSWEGLEECEICHERRIGTSRVCNDVLGRDMTVCRTDRKAVKIANDVHARRGLAAASAAE